MTLIPRDPIFENVFAPMISPVWNRNRGDNSESFFTPRVDIQETDNQYVLSAELPGVQKKDLKLTLDKGQLTLEAETHSENKTEEGAVIRQERRYGKYLRSFNLGAEVEEKDISAEFKDGVLTLTAPKLKSTRTAAKRIKIH